MRYHLSPAERNVALEDLKRHNQVERNYEKGIPRIPAMSAEERYEEHEHRQHTKKVKFGRMTTRRKNRQF